MQASIVTLMIDHGVPASDIFTNCALHKTGKLELPGFFRPTKQWDLLVVRDQHLLAAMELKAQVGPSFGNNFNNRTEEAMGSALDSGQHIERAHSFSHHCHGSVTCFCWRTILNRPSLSAIRAPTLRFSGNSMALRTRSGMSYSAGSLFLSGSTARRAS